VAVRDYCGRLLLTLEIALLALGCVTCEVILEKVLIVICNTNELMTNLHAAVALTIYQFYLYTNSSNCYKDDVVTTN
jgi:hypothetical protein